VAGLALSHLTLSHFRSHKFARLVPAPGAIALFGANGAGKTNILEAVSLLSPGRGLRRAAAEEFARAPEQLGWKITAELSGPDEAHSLETWAEPGQSRQVRIDDKAATQSALGRVARMVWLVPSMDRLWLEGAEGRRRFLDRITLSFFPGHADVSLAYEKAMRERNRLLKDGVADDHWYRALERAMAEAGAELHRNRSVAITRLAAAQSGAETAFPAAHLTLTGPDDADPPNSAEELTAAFTQGRARDMAAGRTLIGPHRADLAATYAAKGVAARQCSTGEQKALLISLILANARALTADFGAPPIILLDEVSAHLDETRRAALYDEICALGAQAWLTGTEISLFEALGTRAQYLEITEQDGISGIQERTVM